MPTTDFDDEIIADLVPGTRIIHRKFGKGVVLDNPPGEPAYGQMLVRFDDYPIGTASKVWVYPVNLERE